MELLTFKGWSMGERSKRDTGGRETSLSILLYFRVLTFGLIVIYCIFNK